MDCYGKYYYIDGLVFQTGTGEEQIAGDTSFYEVIRTFSGTPVFFDDHVKRLTDGISTRYAVPSDMKENIRRGIKALVNSELFAEINVRVMVTFTGREHSIHICYIPSFYPSEKTYGEGVKLILFYAERLDPGVKLLNTRMRLSINEELNKQNAYEALLVNRKGLITEGGRSNVFFIKDNGTIFTAPDSLVLKGITRMYVIDLCKKEGIDLFFEPVSVNQLKEFVSVFITGTSPMVLPARSIDNVVYRTDNAIAGRLRKLYVRLAEESIRNYIHGRQAD